MMSGRERRVELIHAELDGQLTRPQKAELGRLLLADPALRDLRAGLRRTCEALDAVPLEDPPACLVASVMESLPASPPACGDRDVHFPRRFGRTGLSYAAAFAGGLIVSAMAFQYGLRMDTFDPRDLTGTIAAVTADPSRLELHLDEVHGTVRLDGTPAAPIVIAELAVTSPVRLIARLEGEELRLEDFAATQHGAPAPSAGFTPRAARTTARVEVSIVDAASGRLLQTTTLRPSVQQRE